MVARGRTRGVFNPTVLMWISREVSAASEAELCAMREQNFVDGSPEAILWRAWFSGIRCNGEAPLGELLVAIWMLHEEAGDLDESSDIAAQIAASTFGARGYGSWLLTARSWLSIWDCDDDHPVLAKGTLETLCSATSLQVACRSLAAGATGCSYPAGFAVAARVAGRVEAPRHDGGDSQSRLESL